MICEQWTLAGLRWRRNPEVAGELCRMRVELRIETGARGGRRLHQIDSHLAILAGFELLLDVLTERVVRGNDGNVRCGLGARHEERTAADERRHKTRDEHGREDEALGAHALHVLALGDKPDVMHGPCLQPRRTLACPSPS